jgi:hypothetical protein
MGYPGMGPFRACFRACFRAYPGLFPGLFPGLSGPVSGVLFRKKNEHFFCQSGARKWGQLGVGNGVNLGVVGG